LRSLPSLIVAAGLFCLAACGGGGSGSPLATGGPASIRTVAYVDTECHEDASSYSSRQMLQILSGDRPPVTLPIQASLSDLPPSGLCVLLSQYRHGVGSVVVGAFQRVGVSPDASAVVFELNFNGALFAQLGVPSPLPPGEEGIYVVGADGHNLRRLGPPSRAPSNYVVGVPSMPGFSVYLLPVFRFSPDSTTIVFPDRGPSATGEDADQIFTMDLATGTRHQITQLSGAAQPWPVNPAMPVTPYAVFVDDQTIAFVSRSNFDGDNPGGAPFWFTVKTDGTDLKAAPRPEVLAGSEIIPVFQITGSIAGVNVFPLTLPGIPVNPIPGVATSIQEIFQLDGTNLLQLTSFRRSDTLNATAAAGRAFFVASPDPFGTNPSENCQVFSMDTLGGDFRQLTRFSTGQHSDQGCEAVRGTGCVAGSYALAADPLVGTLLFDSTCDPFGTNPDGQQIYAMHFDGTGLRQLTALKGVVTAPDGSVDVELPGPTEPDL
jgi:hypothetical protein